MKADLHKGFNIGLKRVTILMADVGFQ